MASKTWLTTKALLAKESPADPMNAIPPKHNPHETKPILQILKTSTLPLQKIKKRYGEIEHPLQADLPSNLQIKKRYGEIKHPLRLPDLQ